ncbi:hypothetical protein BD324DRAFT_643368 [Kockovaella imperatae]|uniref:Ubiquitin-like modifier-activating enzyme ATG7 n=1 Tax=Kockovaella imperatae TaxID=4999 RepID=A0A1Y1UA28_9TREE|nr:hypothetical protein BD324DRAFT_643368 [Kockovaella imperatae]ORX34367.1 hypothetical protein BD324DRAFT_643368 [Kockovaella imperatae]
MPTILQFQPLSSQPSPAFWSALNNFKLEKLKLDDTRQPITAWLEEGREIADREAKGGEGLIGVDGSVGLGSAAFGEEGSHSFRPPLGSTSLKGVFKNFNTVEEFKATDPKKDLFNSIVDEMLDSFATDSPNLNPFLLVTFADLKKYVYHYWFAFPALVSKPAWEMEDRGLQAAEQVDVAEIRALAKNMSFSDGAYLIKGPRGQRSAGPLSSAKSFFEGVIDEERTVAFHDPSSIVSAPGWPLRNILVYLHRVHSISSITVFCLRAGSSRVCRASLPSPETSDKPSAVGWERNKVGKLASRVADLGPMMDPMRLADQAVDLNLKLMRWRIMPTLELDKVASTKCLLLGAGTLGCYVARALMGWGVRNITFVDSARVSYSNPVRQPLFEFEDCLDGGKPKAQCAADHLKRIFPGVNANAHSFLIPMPGHPIPSASIAETKASVAQLESLISSHDAIFLLMDSRESRWLPTVISSSQNKIVINAALGFDSYLVMRHGASPSSQGKRLGCYYCNDIVAPTDSLSDRTLDQMCTVTRPGIAPIASATAVELLTSLVQHPLGINAPAEVTDAYRDEEAGSPLGIVPHQLRGQLSQWKTHLIEGAAYDRCTGCSNIVVDAYRKDAFDMLIRAFNEVDYLEKLTGLDELHKDSEAMMENLDWEEGSEEDF